jgi:hypothetical protein
MCVCAACLQAGLQKLAEAYPDVMAALDDALFSRISSLPPGKVRAGPFWGWGWWGAFWVLGGVGAAGIHTAAGMREVLLSGGSYVHVR